MNRVVALLILLCSTRSFACAQLQITEVMYDPVGSDTGREWVEVQNIGNSSINFIEWKFFEGNTNHGIEQIEGYAINLTPNEYGVIVSDKTKFLTDFPSFSGKIFKSSFSLSNTGETLVFKNNLGTVIDEYTYDVALGAAGDGNTLQKTTTWMTALPTPALPPNGSGGQGVVATSTPTSSDGVVASGPALSGSGATYSAPQLFSTIITPQVAFAGSDTSLQAQSFVSGGKNAVNPMYTWNFGDGTVGYGSMVSHRYRYPGMYYVVLDVMASVDGVTTFASERTSLIVTDFNISLFESFDDKGGEYIKIENKSKHFIDISFWILRKGNSVTQYYVFPKNSFIMPGTSLRVSQEVTRFKNNDLPDTVELLLPSMVPVARYDHAIFGTNVSTTTIHTSSSSMVTKSKQKPSVVNLHQQPQKKKDAIVVETVSTMSVAASSSIEKSSLTTVPTEPEKNHTSIVWYIIPILILSIGAATFLIHKKGDDPLSEYTIIDDGK